MFIPNKKQYNELTSAEKILVGYIYDLYFKWLTERNSPAFLKNSMFSDFARMMSFDDDLILDDSSYFILDESNTIIGFYSLTPYNSHILRYLYIKPEYRKMNYGTSVIQQLLNENKVLKLNCSIKNKNAINFYNKFNSTKTINNDEVTYELEL